MRGFECRWNIRVVAIFVVALGIPSVVPAQEHPLRDARKLIEPRQEAVVRVRGVRVMHADYGALRTDFPELREMTEAQIDQHLVEKTGFVSRPQAAQSVVNTPIEVERGPGRALRPMGYGRALVYKFFGGYIDVKGAGSRVLPEQKSHSNGLMALAETLREFIFENAVRRVLDHAGYEGGTVKSYAVLDLGFDVIWADGSKSPAGLILRQAHQRETPVATFRNWRDGEKIEAVLRRYGLISNHEAMTYPEQTIDRHNLQAAKNGAIVDYGSFLAVPSLNQSTSNPDPNIRLPFDIWGYSRSGNAHPVHDNVRLAADELAREWRKGRADRNGVAGFVDSFVTPLDQRYPGQPGLRCMRLFR